MIETRGSSFRINPSEEQAFRGAMQRGDKTVPLETMHGTMINIVLSQVEAWYINTPELRQEMREFNKKMNEEEEVFEKENKKPEWDK